MQDFLSRDFIKRVQGQKILLAVSGGADSMVLLDIVRKANEFVEFDFAVIHVNHNLRGKESDLDAMLVENYCKKHNVLCTIKNVNVMKYKNQEKLTLEESARNLRHKVIFDHVSANKFDYVVFAHNAGDQAETVLMHIARGSGLSGACGIKETSKVLRPLIGISKKDIYDYANENKIEFREDKSNVDTKYSRNFIRYEILPRLQQIFPSIEENLCKFAGLVQEDENYIQSTIDYSQIKSIGRDYLVPSDMLNGSHTICSRVVKNVMERLGIFADIEQRHIELIKDLARQKNGNVVTLPHGVFAIKEYQNVKFTTNIRKNLQTDFQSYQLGKIQINDQMSVVVSEIDQNEVCFGDGAMYFDLDSIPHTSVFRTKRVGDKFKRFGSGSKLLSNYFTDKKIPRFERDKVIVLCNDSDVLMVLGDDISEQIKITDNTSRFGKIVIEKK